eukprot:gene1692-2283_t
MYSILTGSLVISLLHAVIPNHWLPIIAIGRKEQWTAKEVRQVTLLAALAHAASTVTIGLVLSGLGKAMAQHVGQFTHFIAPAILLLLGVFFIYRHHRHKHFHVNENVVRKQTKARILFALVVAMFFSPCMEIEAYFLLAGAQAKWLVWCMALLYILVTTTGMVVFVNFAYKGLLKLNWHSLEHNADCCETDNNDLPKKSSNAN